MSLKILSIALLSAITCGAQETTISLQTGTSLKVVVAAPGQSSDSIIAIPPDISWSASLSFSPAKSKSLSNPGSLDHWLHQQSERNGLQSPAMPPWHIVIAYDQFDEDGDNVHSGIVDEIWAGPKKYRLTYKSDGLNQTDYATAQGLFRAGDQRWPNRSELQARTEVIDPFAYAATLIGYSVINVERAFGPHSLDCTVLQHGPGAITAPTQYCFEPGTSVLRYSRGYGWYQTTYNNLASLAGRNVAREVTVTDGGKPYLKLQVKTIEPISPVDEDAFVPPADAVKLGEKRITGVSLKPLKQPFPTWPDSLRQEHFSVTVEIIVGKDGHVVSAHATNGPAHAQKAAEETAKQWVFQPFFVLDQPAEVETKIILNNN